jgi:Ca2+-transporting ATPase
LVWRIIIVGVMILVAAIGLFEYELMRGESVRYARTAAVNAVVMILTFYVLNCRSLSQSMFQIGVFSNRWVVVGVVGMVLLQLLFTYFPPMEQFFSVEPIDLESWGYILAAGFASYVIIEIEKWFRRRTSSAGGKPAVVGSL